MSGTWRTLGCMAVIFLGSAGSQAASAEFKARELFRIPFGLARGALGARVEGGNFLIPRTFTMDGAGHFYVDDTNHHRIARFSFDGTYEMEFRYPVTARQVFAHADSRQNLWLLVGDPAQGMFYGVYDSAGKSLRSGIFSRFNRFNLHLDDDGALHVILSSQKNSSLSQTYILDEKNLLMKKEGVARPPEDHHQIIQTGRVFYMDPLPGASKDDGHAVTRITDQSHHGVADIPGTVVYLTGRGEVYTRVGKREIRVYEVDGSLKGSVFLRGLSSACSAVRFDSDGNLYELDGIPDQTDEELRRAGLTAGANADFEDLHYSPSMTGMRLVQWERR